MHERGYAALLADPTRLRPLLHRHWDEIRRHLERCGVPLADVDDLAQEAFLVAASKLAPAPSSGDRAFLYAIATRLAHNARRARVRRHRAHDLYGGIYRDPPPTPEDLLERMRARALLDAVLRAMPPELRTVLVLTELDDATVPDVARRLALPIGTAASRLRRAREAFTERAARALAQ